MRLPSRMGFSERTRRDFITLIGGAAAWPALARGQEAGRIYRLGCLFAGPRDAPHYVPLFGELRRLGFIEGQTLAPTIDQNPCPSSALARRVAFLGLWGPRGWGSAEIKGSTPCKASLRTDLHPPSPISCKRFHCAKQA